MDLSSDADAQLESTATADSPSPEANEGGTNDALASVPPVAPAPRDLSARTALLLVAALAAAVLFVLPPLARSGIWDPYELNVADLSRRMAVTLHGASNLALEDADNSLPHLNDLGRPQLAFTSIALGFKFFGLHDWAGRLPLAVWGAIALFATYAFLARLTDRKTGVFAAAVLASMPLFAVQARTMLGDIVPMAAFILALGGLLVVLLDRDTVVRVAWFVVAVVGLAAGFYSRGGLLGVAAPCLGAGLTWALLVFQGRSRDVLAHGVGALSLALGGYAAVKGYIALDKLEYKNDLNAWVGALIRPPAKYPTFDFTIAHIGHAVAPWSAFVPVALGRMFMAPRASAEREQSEGEVRAALLLSVSIALGISGFLSARVEFIAFTGVAALACVCAMALRDYERGAHPTIALAVVCAVFLGLFHHDFHQFPEKAYQAFAITTTSFPENFKERSLALWTVVLIGFAALVLLTWVERDPKREPFDAKNYKKALESLQNAWEGNLAVGYFALIAGSSIAGLALWWGTRTHAPWLAKMNPVARDVVSRLWWMASLAPPALVFGTMFACDVWLWAFDRAGEFGKQSLSRGLAPLKKIYEGATSNEGSRGEQEGWTDQRFYLFVLSPLAFIAIPVATFGALFLGAHTSLPIAAVVAVPSGVLAFIALGVLGDVVQGSRASFLVFAAVGLGLVLSGVYYPDLASQLSPKQVFETYAQKKKDGDPLALYGVGGKTAAYYAGGQPTVLSEVSQSFLWLTTKGNESRRFMAVRGDELSSLNQLYRQREHHNIPVVDGRSSQILLLASKLESGEKNENPLSAYVNDARPSPQRPLDVNLEDKLRVLGITILDENRRQVESVAPNKKLHLVTFYEVLAPITTDWEAFIHIDGYHRRHNGDHKPCSGKYAMSRWVQGDIITDDYEFTLEPNFTSGDYTIFFGFWLGEGRMKVKSGPSDGDNRINGGALKIR